MAKTPKYSDMNYKSLFRKESKDEDAVTNRDVNAWWTLPPEEARDAISSVLDFFKNNQRPRLNQWYLSAKLYGNTSSMGPSLGLQAQGAIDRTNTMFSRMSDNIIQSTIDTLVAKLSKNKPFPLFLTSDGDYRQRRKAKKLNQFLEGVFAENDVYELGTQVLKDACIFGTGVAHVYVDTEGRVRFERVVPHEIWMDELEAVYGEGRGNNIGPRQMHRAKTVNRSVLMSSWPDMADEIANASAPITSGQTIPTIADILLVRESWHLPSSPGAKDGRHIISTEEIVLVDEIYEDETFPFIFLNYNKRVFGLWGQGLAEMNQHLQLEINRILWTIQFSYQLAGSFKILVENSSKISDTHLDNKIGTIIHYTGSPPTYITPPIIPPEMYTHWQQLRQTAYSNSGISLLSAGSQKPQGLDSGKALREFNDIESDRFMAQGQAYERFFVGLGNLAIDAIKNATKGRGSYKVKSFDKFVREIDWKEIGIKDDTYNLTVFPVSSLPNTPTGRLQTIKEYVQAGWISQSQGRRLMDFPDIDQVEDLQNAQEELIYETMDKIIDSEDESYTFEPPEPYDNLQLARQICLQYMSKYRGCGLEPEKLELLRRYISQIDSLEAAAAAQAQATAANQQTQQQQQVPQGKPQGAPQSDLLPQS